MLKGDPPANLEEAWTNNTSDPGKNSNKVLDYYSKKLGFKGSKLNTNGMQGASY